MSLLNSRSINISSQKMIIIIQQHSTILEKLSFYRNISENIYKSPECLKMKENFVFKIGNLAIIDLKIMRGKNSIVIMVNNWGPNCLFLHICQSLFFSFITVQALWKSLRFSCSPWQSCSKNTRQRQSVHMLSLREMCFKCLRT